MSRGSAAAIRFGMVMFSISVSRSQTCDESAVGVELLQTGQLLLDKHGETVSEVSDLEREGEREMEKGRQNPELSTDLQPSSGAPEMTDIQRQNVQQLKQLIWLHVPKCGSSFTNVIAGHRGICPFAPEGPAVSDEILNANHLPWIHHNMQVKWCPLSLDRNFGYYAQHANFGYQTHLSAHVVIMIRQPEERLLSAYNYRQHGWPFDTPAQNALEYAKVMQGCVVKTLMRPQPVGIYLPSCSDPIPPTAAEVSQAKQLLGTFPFVGLTDHWDLSICLFHAIFGGACHEYELDIIRRGADADLSDLAGFRDVHDGELYIQGNRSLFEQLDMYGISEASCANLCPRSAP